MRAEIDLKEDAVFIVKNGSLTKIKPKEFGQDTIIWKHGQVLDVDRSERLRIEGQKII